jgi:hypothetical protein
LGGGPLRLVLGPAQIPRKPTAATTAKMRSTASWNASPGSPPSSATRTRLITPRSTRGLNLVLTYQPQAQTVRAEAPVSLDSHEVIVGVRGVCALETSACSPVNSQLGAGHDRATRHYPQQRRDGPERLRGFAHGAALPVGSRTKSSSPSTATGHCPRQPLPTQHAYPALPAAHNDSDRAPQPMIAETSTTWQNGGYFSPSSPVIHMSVCPRSPSKSADVTGVAPEKSLGPYCL